MAFENLKISAEEINRLNVKSAADSYSNNSPRDNKNIFDRLPEHIAEKHNLLAEAVEEFAENVYTKDETEKAINEKMVAVGAGDMQKAVYDTDGDGVVDTAQMADNAAKLDGHEADYFMPKSGGTFTGSVLAKYDRGSNWAIKNNAVMTSAGGEVNTAVYAILFLRK